METHYSRQSGTGEIHYMITKINPQGSFFLFFFFFDVCIWSRPGWWIVLASIFQEHVWISSFPSLSLVNMFSGATAHHTSTVGLGGGMSATLPVDAGSLMFKRWQTHYGPPLCSSTDKTLCPHSTTLLHINTPTYFLPWNVLTWHNRLPMKSCHPSSLCQSVLLWGTSTLTIFLTI